MNEGVTFFFFEFERSAISVVIYAGDEHDLCPIGLGRLDFRDGCAVGKANRRLNAAVLSRKGDALCVISRRAGDDASGFLGSGELRNFVVCAANLERTGDLQVFRF